jgi:molecular chaperone Hsp33
MLDPNLPLNTLLYRLFHEEGIRVFPPIAIEKGCRCSAEKIRTVMDNLSDDEKQEYAENGVISVTCEFCNTTYEFPVSPRS